MSSGAVRYKTEKHRKFGGKVFERRWHFGTKSQANKYAESEKRKGRQVRIVRHVGVYTVYTH